MFEAASDRLGLASGQLSREAKLPLGVDMARSRAISERPVFAQLHRSRISAGTSASDRLHPSVARNSVFAQRRRMGQIDLSRTAQTIISPHHRRGGSPVLAAIRDQILQICNSH